MPAPGTLARAGKREDEPFRILHIFGLHMLPNQELKQKWVASLDILNPDLVIDTGDNPRSDKTAPSILAALGPLLGRPGAFVFGTNDCFAPWSIGPPKYPTGKKRKPSCVELPWRGIHATFIEYGWQDAIHARLELVAGGVKVALSGVDNPHHELEDYSQVAGAPNADADIAIGLPHPPEPHVLDASVEDGYDLVLSGRTRGDQTCLSEGKAIVTNCGISRSQAPGLLRWIKKTWLHISNDLGTSPCASIRLFRRPSATLTGIMERDPQLVIRRGTVRSL